MAGHVKCLQCFYRIWRHERTKKYFRNSEVFLLSNAPTKFIHIAVHQKIWLSSRCRIKIFQERLCPCPHSDVRFWGNEAIRNKRMRFGCHWFLIVFFLLFLNSLSQDNDCVLRLFFKPTKAITLQTSFANIVKLTIRPLIRHLLAVHNIGI